MKISRRNFIGALSASVATLLPFAAKLKATGLERGIFGNAALRTMSSDALSQLSWRSFYPYLYTDFEFSTVRRGARALNPNRLTLSAMVNDGPVMGKIIAADPACFILTFKEPAGVNSARLSQNTYTVNHFALG